MSGKSERQAAREAVAALTAFEVDQVLFQYSRAAKELWKFCNLPDDDVFTAQLIGEGAPVDWWDRGAPRRR